VDGELIAYSAVEQTAANKYTMSGYIRRGMYGTPITAHAEGSQFCRIDANVLKIPYTPDRIGKTAYVKFCSFNNQGQLTQPLDEAPTYAHYIEGPPLPFPVQQFEVEQVGNVVSFTWLNIDTLYLYAIGYAPVGTTNWANFQLLTDNAKGAEMTNAAVPPGDWVFAIRSIDPYTGLMSPTWPTVELTVTRVTGNIILSDEEDASWDGFWQ
jgi:hypothetical protein